MKLPLLLAMTLSVASAPGSAGPARLALVGARIYTAPGEPAIPKGVVLVEGSRIVGVAPWGTLTIPADAEVIDVSGGVVTAGFWNCHVHFVERKWSGAGSIPAAELEQQLQAMLTGYGFASVFDTGSDGANTRLIRDRVLSGEVKGPRVLSTGEILFPRGGRFPVDLLLALGFTAGLGRMPEVETAEQAGAAAQRLLDQGADGVKLYAATWRPPIVAMAPEAVRVAAAAAHARGRPVFAHPSNARGLQAAVDNGVDVLVHATPEMGRWPEGLLRQMRDRNVALIPTLKLFRWETRHDRRSQVDPLVNVAVDQLRAYAAAGGTVLFGTDVGYIDDYDPTEEYQLMADAGLSFEQILAALTTNPARRFGGPQASGRLAAGEEADLVVLEGDPAQDVRAFARVRYTVRGGRLIFSLTPPGPASARRGAPARARSASPPPSSAAGGRPGRENRRRPGPGPG